jgi:hypothetical protein
MGNGETPIQRLEPLTLIETTYWVGPSLRSLTPTEASSMQ